MNGKHTPGPWELRRYTRVGGDGACDVTVVQPGGGPHGYASLGIATVYGADDEQNANARLLAAAPELGEACRAFVDSQTMPLNTHMRELQQAEAQQDACEKAWAALRKAGLLEGGE